jgi:hypothetical protein
MYVDPSKSNPLTLEAPIRPLPQFVRTAAREGRGATQTTARPGAVTRATSSTATAQPSVEAPDVATPTSTGPISYATLTEDQKEELRTLQADFLYLIVIIIVVSLL